MPLDEFCSAFDDFDDVSERCFDKEPTVDSAAVLFDETCTLDMNFVGDLEKDWLLDFMVVELVMN